MTGDFNGDGRTDLAAANQYDNNASVLLGNGDGTFTTPGQLATDLHATPLVADVNGDGTDDVLVIDAAGEILYRQGIPEELADLLPPVTVNPGNPARDIAYVSTPLGPVIAAVDSLDNAVSFYAYQAGGFVRRGYVLTGRLPAQIVSGNLFGDGGNDLVVRNAIENTLTVIPESTIDVALSGVESPLPTETLAVGVGVSDVELIDTTGSGSLDLVLTNQLTGLVSVIRNLGGEHFGSLVPYRASDGLLLADGSGTVTSFDATAGVVAAPFTPGRPTDLLTLNPGSNTLGLLAGSGGGRFANPVDIKTANSAQVVRVGDFTNNGIPDLAVLTSDTVDIYLGNGRGGFSRPISYNAGPDPTGLTVKKLLPDGNLDLFVGDAYGDVLVLAGQGDGTFRPLLDVGNHVALAVADLTGKGTKDVIYAYQGLDRVSVDYGAGQKQPLTPTSPLLAPGAVAVAHLNGPNQPADLIVANSGGNDVLVYPGLGNGQFGPALNDGKGFFTGTDPVGITVADLNGRPDLIVADRGSNQVSILLNQATADGGFTFVPGPRLNFKTVGEEGIGPVATAIVPSTSPGGQPSLAVSMSGSNQVWMIPSVGGGFFNDQNPTIFNVGHDPGPIFVGNFDGQTDLVSVNAGSNDLTVISGLGSSDLTSRTISSGGVDPVTAFAFNSGNGFESLVVGNSGDGVLALLEGGADGLSLTSILPENVPNLTALAFSAMTGGQIEFFAASAGGQSAIPLEFSLGAETFSEPTPAPSNTFAQLIPLSESSLALVGSLLTVSLENAGFESESGAETAVVFLTAPGPSVNQPLFRQGSSAGTPGDDDEEPVDPEAESIKTEEATDPSSRDSSILKHFLLGKDAAREYQRVHPAPATGNRPSARVVPSQDFDGENAILPAAVGRHASRSGIPCHDGCFGC